MPMTHFGDPCIHCDTPHDEVAPGPCLGDLRKVRPIRFRDFGQRQDRRRHLLVLFSDGSLEDYWLHPDEPDPWMLQLPPILDQNLSR